MADVTLPQLGETVTEGTITQWFKQVGDTVAADEPLFEVSTDKVDTEVPSPVAGVVTEIRAAEGDTIEVGTVVAVVGDAGSAPAAEPESAPAPAPEPEPAPAPPAAPAPAPAPEAQPAPAPAPAPPTQAPAPAAQAPAQPATPSATADDSRLLSPVVRRLVNEHHLNPDDIPGTGAGGRITRDDVMDYIDRTGAKPVASGGDAGAAGSSASGDGGSSTSGSVAPAAAAAGAATAAAAAGASSGTSAQAGAPSTGASAAGSSSTGATASTAGGSTSGGAAAPSGSPQAAPGERDTVVKLSKIRQLTGDHMVKSKATSPHAFSVVEVDFANVDRTRDAVKAEFKSAEGFSLTYLPFIARALVDAIAEFPHMNASVSDNQLIVHQFVDLAIAVDLDYEGLLAPVIRDAESKRLRAIAREISDLANRARARKLSPDEISGGTFTISNNGSAGSVLTMPIINQPQVAIISTDAIVRRPVVVNGGQGDAIAVHPVGNLSMSWDHRAFDGAYAAGFLKKVKEILETRDWGTEL